LSKNWNGSTGAFRNGDNWSPSGAPAAGDDLTIAAGLAKLRHGSFGSADATTAIHLTGDASDPAGLTVANATLKNVRIDEVTGVPGDYAARTGTLVIKGQVVNDGGAFVADGNVPVNHVLNIEMRPGATLVNEGTIGADPGASLNVDGSDAAGLENDGTISAVGGTVTVSAHLTGTGDLYAAEGRLLGGSIELKGAVDAGQTVHLNRGGVQVDAPDQFLGSVDLPAVSGGLSLEGLDAASWASDGNLLELFNASGALADTVRLTPQANPVDLKVSAFTDPTYGQGVSITAVPPGFPSNIAGALPQQDFVSMA